MSDDELQALLLVGKGFRLPASAGLGQQGSHICVAGEGMANLRMYELPLRAWGTTLAAAAQPA